MFRSPLTDALVVIVILLLIVGPKKLPQLGRGLGDGMREFKEGITGDHKGDRGASKGETAGQPLTLHPAEPPVSAPAASDRPAQPAAAPRSETERSA